MNHINHKKIQTCQFNVDTCARDLHGDDNNKELLQQIYTIDEQQQKLGK